jgi:uncharacterized membrane protein YfcA
LILRLVRTFCRNSSWIFGYRRRYGDRAFVGALNYAPVQAVATSGLSIVITAISGSIQNWRMGYLSLSQVAGIGFPAVITAQIGAYLAGIFPPYLLLLCFGLLLWLNIYLIEVRNSLRAKQKAEAEQGELGGQRDKGKILNYPLPITNYQKIQIFYSIELWLKLLPAVLRVY